MPAFCAAKRQIDIIDEQWKENHLEAMSCWAFEDLLRLCVETFERIGRHDEGWRSSVFRGELPYSYEEEENLLALYADWKDVCEHFLVPLSSFEARGYVIECAERFRSCIGEAHGISTPDAEFFVGDAMVDLRDKAIEDNRRGEVEHVGGPR
jgi:hypothetical protein